MNQFFKKIFYVDGISINPISSWKSKGLFDNINKPPKTSKYSLAPELFYDGNRMKVIFGGGCLKQDGYIYVHGTIVNIYILFMK